MALPSVKSNKFYRIQDKHQRCLIGKGSKLGKFSVSMEQNTDKRHSIHMEWYFWNLEKDIIR